MENIRGVNFILLCNSQPNLATLYLERKAINKYEKNKAMNTRYKEANSRIKNLHIKKKKTK